MSENEVSEVGPGEDPAGRRGMELYQPLSESGQLFHTFPVATMEEKFELLKVLEGTHPRMSTQAGKEFAIVGFLCHTGQFRNANGDLEESTRLVVKWTDGTCSATMGGGFLRSMGRTFGVLGHPKTWPGPLVVRIDEVPLASGKKTFKLSPLRFEVKEVSKKK